MSSLLGNVTPAHPTLHSPDFEDVKRTLRDNTNKLSKTNNDQESLLKVLIHPISNQTVLVPPYIESNFL